MKTIGLVLILAALPFLPAPAADLSPSAAEDKCAANLKRLGAAWRTWQFVNEGAPPANLGELYFAGYVDSPGRYSCPAGDRRLTTGAEASSLGDYTTEPLSGQPAFLVREKQPRHGTNLLLALSTNGSIIKLQMEPTNLPVVITHPPPQAPPNVAATNRPPVVPTPNSVPLPLPGPLTETLAQAEKLSASGRFSEALPLLDRALAQNATNQLALWSRGLARTWTGDLQGSVTDLDALLALDPSNLDVRRVRSLTALAGGIEVATVRATMTELLRAQPNHAQLLLVAGQAELASGDNAAAQRYFARATAADPQLIQGVYQQAGQFLQAGVPKMAYLQFMAVVWSSPNFAGGHYGAGMAASRLGYQAQATQAFEQYLRLDPSSSFAATARQELERLRRAR